MKYVTDYVIEEVTRQGHKTTVPEDGFARVVYMLNAWQYALVHEHHNPTVDDIRIMGRLVEPDKNPNGFRRCGVMVGIRVCPNWQRVPDLLVTLFEQMPDYADRPIAFYKEFEMIHPFIDGNGRTGKVLLNWLNHTLDAPVFPPADLWGRPIRNP